MSSEGFGFEAWVPGVPIPQGSMRAFVRGKHAVLVHAKGSDLAAWRAAVGAVVGQAMRRALPGRGLLEDLVMVGVEFRMPIPQTHWSKRGGLKPGAPVYPLRPDVDKLIRAVLDALTGSVLVDDRQVVILRAIRRWALDPDDPRKPGPVGAWVRVAQAGDRP